MPAIITDSVAEKHQGASVCRVLSSLVGAADGGVSEASGGLLVVRGFRVAAAPLLLAVAGVDELAVLLDGVGGRLDESEAALATDGFSGGELLALLVQPGRLGFLLFPLAPLALGFLLGAVLLDGGRCDPRGQLRDYLRAGERLRLVDALPIGARQPCRVDEPLRDEQAEDDRKRRLWSPRPHQRAQRLLVQLPLGLRAPRVAHGHVSL